MVDTFLLSMTDVGGLALVASRSRAGHPTLGWTSGTQRVVSMLPTDGAMCSIPAPRSVRV